MANRVERFTSEFCQSYPVPKSGRVWVWEAGTGLGLRVTSKGARSFVAVYRLKGDEKRVTLGPATMKLAEAKRLTRDYQQAAREGRDPLGGRSPAQARRGAITLKEIFSGYLAYCRDVRMVLPREDDNSIVPHTLANIESTMNGLIEEFGRLEWPQVKPSTWQAWHANHENGQRARANIYVVQWKEAWAWARRSGLLPEEARSAADLFGDFKPYQRKARTRNLSDEEYGKLFRSLAHFRKLREEGDFHITASSLNHLELALMIGQRKSSLYELRWDDDREGNLIEMKDGVPSQIVFRRKHKLKYAKPFPITPEVAALLMRIKQDQIVGIPSFFPARSTLSAAPIS
jgi:hypothetical protein